MKTVALILAVLCLGACKQKMVDARGDDCSGYNLAGAKRDVDDARREVEKYRARIASYAPMGGSHDSRLREDYGFAVQQHRQTLVDLAVIQQALSSCRPAK